jgi:hypothetical protein
MDACGGRDPAPGPRSLARCRARVRPPGLVSKSHEYGGPTSRRPTIGDHGLASRFLRRRVRPPDGISPGALHAC